jgi:hypothetical protein
MKHDACRRRNSEASEAEARLLPRHVPARAASESGRVGSGVGADRSARALPRADPRSESAVRAPKSGFR